MNNIVLILGIGFFCFLLLYLYSVLKRDSEDTPAVGILRLILLFAALGTMFLIPKAALDDSQVCEWVINKTEEVYKYGDNYTAYHWDYSATPPTCNAANELDCVNLFHRNQTYTYSQLCYTKQGSTPDVFLGAVLWFYRIFATFVVCYLGYEALRFLMYKTGITGVKEE